jgi:hypothetical protein
MPPFAKSYRTECRDSTLEPRGCFLSGHGRLCLGTGGAEAAGVAAGVAGGVAAEVVAVAVGDAVVAAGSGSAAAA